MNRKVEKKLTYNPRDLVVDISWAFFPHLTALCLFPMPSMWRLSRVYIKIPKNHPHFAFASERGCRNYPILSKNIVSKMKKKNF